MALLVKDPQTIAKDHISLYIELNGTDPVPGQFLNIKVGSDTDPLIRRPFSIYDYNNGLYEIIVRVVGKGTEILSTMRKGFIDVLGPLGKGFTIIKSGHALLVGGGVGNAPLYFLAKKLKQQGVKVTCIYGAASSDLIYNAYDFRKACDRFEISTDDGSMGFKGFSTDLMKKLMGDENYDMVYTCGPEAMMEGIVREAGPVDVEVSLENYFGCGVGICSGCVFDTSDGYKRACIDGPVYDGKKVLWQVS